MRLTLASTSPTRAAVLRAAGVPFEVSPPKTDESELKRGLLREGADPRAVAGALAEAKARSVAEGIEGLVLGADQTLDLDGALFDKPADLGAARDQLLRLRGREHRLHSALVVAMETEIVWRTTATPRLAMRDFSDDFLERYLREEGEAVSGSVGGYRLEGLGAQLFSSVEGDWFAVLGLPLYDLLGFLRERGVLQA